MPTRLREAGVDISAIGSLAGLLALPWALKFLWAPAVDMLRTPRWTLSSWIVSSQLLMGLALLPLLFLDLRGDLRLVVTACLLHAVAAATQDVAVDALAVRSIPADERGAMTAWMQGGMLLGRSLFGGGALLLGSLLGEAAVILMMIGAIWSSLLLLLWNNGEKPVDNGPGTEETRSFIDTLRASASRRSTWQGLGFALVAGAGFEAAGAVAGPFLLDHGLSKASVGWFLSLPVVAAMLAGAAIGGRLSDRRGRRSSAAISLGLTSAAVLALAAGDAAGAGVSALLALWIVLYVAIGLFTASTYALFMELTDPRLGATQFSAYMGATNACESWSAALGGRLIAAHGYSAAFSIMALLSAAAFPLLRAAADDAAPDKLVE